MRLLRSKRFGSVAQHPLVSKPVPATVEGIDAELSEWAKWLAIAPPTTRPSDRWAVAMRRLRLLDARHAMTAVTVEGA